MSQPSDKTVQTAAAPPAPAAGKTGKKVTLPETTEALPWTSNHEIKKESNPFTDRDWRMLVYAWSGMVVRLIIIFGGLFSVYQYLANAEEKRINGTFALLEVWERPEYQQAQLAVRKRIADLNTKYAGLLGPNPSQGDLKIYMDRIGLEAMSADGGTLPYDQFKTEFDRLVYVLNRVATCVQAGQCSQKVTDDYFRDLSVSFWNYFAKYVRNVRISGSTTFAAPIEQYVTGKQPDLTSVFATSKK